MNIIIKLCIMVIILLILSALLVTFMPPDPLALECPNCTHEILT